jgi:single-stranded-DNA-specific exonuclease
VSQQNKDKLDARKWILPDPDSAGIPSSGIPALIKAILNVRGITDSKEYLNPKLNALSDPFEIPNMDGAVDRIFQAIDKKESLVIYGDYDVDGVTSVTLLKKILSAYGIEAIPFLPHRIEEGYGLSINALTRCLEEFSPSLIIAVDCGTTSNEEISWLNEKNVETVILDHHEASSLGAPDCSALVNPKATRDLSESNYDYFCSVGIVFKVAHALLKRRPLEEFDLREFLDLVAVGTVSDLVPLIDENRALVKRGLVELGRTKNAGLSALIELANIRPPYSAMDIGFRIGPRINAAGRIDTAGKALELLLSTDSAKAVRIADELEERNRQRQDLERRTTAEALEMIDSGQFGTDHMGLVLGKRGWHPGVVGIVASRISKKIHRPVFIVAINEDGIGKGSGRSIEGISLVEVIGTGDQFLISGGGHHMAAGITIDENQINAFHDHLCAHVYSNSDKDCLIPKLKLDAECSLNELNLDLLDHYIKLEPFGCENPEPLLFCRGVTPTSEPRILKEKHIRMTLRHRDSICDAIYFNGTDYDLPKTPWDIAFTVLRNDFRGKISIQMNIKAIRSAIR